MKNPKWHRKELILALDLYFKLEPGQISSRNSDIIELSENLNRLDIYKDKPDAIKYRNPNGVAMKLNNFKSYDPNYPGVGLSRGGKLDGEIFEEFFNNRERLKKEAFSILSSIK
jgi:5-methylcytosine-specific restriction protein A